MTFLNEILFLFLICLIGCTLIILPIAHEIDMFICLRIAIEMFIGLLILKFLNYYF